MADRERWEEIIRGVVLEHYPGLRSGGEPGGDPYWVLRYAGSCKSAFAKRIAEQEARIAALTTALQAAAKLIEAYEAGAGAMQLIEPRGAYHDALEAADV